MGALHAAYDDEPFVVVTDAAPVDQGHRRVELRPRHGPGRPAHGLGARPCARSTTWSRAPRARPSSAPTWPSGLPETTGLPLGGLCTREHHRPRRGSWPPEGRPGSRPAGCPTWPWWPPPTAGPVPAAGVFTSNLAAAAPVQVSRAHLEATGGRAAGVILTSGNANAATGEPGREAATRLCDAVAARGSAPSPTRSWSARPG